MRLKGFNAKTIMVQGRLDMEFMKYFPNSCYRRSPPKEYFWKVYSILQPEQFKKQYDENLNRIIRRCRKPETLKVGDEHRHLMMKYKEENMKLLIALKRTGTSKNLVYLKRTKKINQSQPTLDRLLEQKNNSFNINEESDEGNIYEEE